METERLVVVAFVAVALPEMKRLPWIVVEPMVVFPEDVRVPKAADVPKRFVELAMEEKNAVVVALVAVALPVMVKLPSTVDDAPETKPPFKVRRLEKMLVPEKVLLSLSSVDEAKRQVEVETAETTPEPLAYKRPLE